MGILLVVCDETELLSFIYNWWPGISQDACIANTKLFNRDEDGSYIGYDKFITLIVHTHESHGL